MKWTNTDTFFFPNSVGKAIKQQGQGEKLGLPAELDIEFLSKLFPYSKKINRITLNIKIWKKEYKDKL